MAKDTLALRMTDNRVIQYHIRRGAVTETEWQAHLDSLPDEAEEGAETETRFAASFETRHYGDQPHIDAGLNQD